MAIRIHNLFFSIPSDESATLFQVAGTALTSSYTRIGVQMNTEGATTVFLHIFWSIGDETSIDVQARYTNRSGGTETVPTQIETAGSPNTLIPSEFRYSNTTFANFVVPFGVEGKYVNFYIKSNGGTPTGTYSAAITAKRE